MGKRIVLFTTMLGACAAGQMMGMEQESKCAKQTAQFYLSNGLKIKSFSIEAQDLCEKPAKFKGQEFLQTLPFDKSDKLKLKNAFALARKTNQKATESYTLEQVQFLATITPLIKGKKDKKNFFVEVQPVAQVSEQGEEQTNSNPNKYDLMVIEAMFEL